MFRIDVMQEDDITKKDLKIFLTHSIVPNANMASIVTLNFNFNRNIQTLLSNIMASLRK
jgi:hypothetical protein